jgi:hypothetical protein
MYPFSYPFLAESAPFLFNRFLIYYQKIELILKEMDGMTVKTLDTNACDYCSGNGYFQLLLGGSETCNCCGGTGKKEE